MGRKKSINSPKNYFDKPEEEAVIEYLKSDSVTRDKIFNEKLYMPLRKMVESIIKRYGFIREDISFEELADETLSHVVYKFDKFIPAKNKKAYSYYGTVAHNYLKAQRIKYSTNKNRYVSYEDISSDLASDSKYGYEMSLETPIETFDFIQVIIDKLSDELLTNEKLKSNDIKVGTSIIDLLKNWEEFLKPEDDDSKKSQILNRNKILYYIRESSFLGHKEVRNSMKKFKVFYNLLKGDMYD